MILGLLIFIGLPLYFMVHSIGKIIKKDYIFDIKFMRLKGDKLKFRNNFANHRLPIISLTFDGFKYNFLIDTGADVNLLNESSFKAINSNGEISTVVNNNISTAGGNVETTMTTLNFKYGNNKFREDFVVINVDEAFNNVLMDNGIRLDGVLGIKFFDKHKWSLDFDNMVIWTK